MKNAIFVFLLFLSLTCPALAERTCVLSFFAPDSAENSIVQSVFDKSRSASVFSNADLADVQSCFRGTYTEIIWIAHGASGANGVSYPMMMSVPASGVDSKRKPPVQYQPIYGRFFERLKTLLDENQDLKKVRVAVCGIDPDNPSSMSEFLRDLSAYDIALDLSPRFEAASALLGRPVTRLSVEWLAKSIDRWSLQRWSTPTNKWCERDYWPGCNRANALYVLPD